MRKKAIIFGRRVLAVLLAVSVAGCSMVDGRFREGSRDVELMAREMHGVVIDEWDTIYPYLESAGSGSRETVDYDPEEVIERMLEEEGGTEYLSFCFSAAVTGDSRAVLDKAKELLPEEVYNELLAEVDQVESELSRQFESSARELNDENREDFMRDMQQLISRTIVLLTASVVYAFMPHFMIFGKVSAAAAISVAAGAVAVTVMSIYRYYTFGGELMASFEEWLKAVATEPKVSYALATSVISMATAMEMSPVSCGIILGVFAIYQAVDLLRTMVETYEL